MIQLTKLFAALAMLLAPASHVMGGPQVVGKVESCQFPSRSLPPPFQVPEQFADGFKLFQAAGVYVPEQITMKSVILMGDSQLHLTAEETRGLCESLDQVYGKISSDALFRSIPSALPYCLSDKRPSQGHYFACFPDKVTGDTQVIVFLHGFGGNFLFYTYLLKQEFPQAIILVPSWGASWEDGTMQYIDDMYKDVKRKRSLLISKPCLMAISAGGPAGFRLYNENPARFSSYISIASAPPVGIVHLLKDNLRILMVNGKTDSSFPISEVKPIATKIAERLPSFQFHVLDGDHFFLLSKREETFRIIKAFLGKTTNGQIKTPPTK